MNRNDYEKYLTTLTEEQILDIKNLAEIEYIKRLVWKSSANLLKYEFQNKEYVLFDGKELKANSVAKYFYKELNEFFVRNKFNYLRASQKSGNTLMKMIGKDLKLILNTAKINERINILMKENGVKFGSSKSCNCLSMDYENQK